MKASFKRSYVKSETGNPVFVHEVTGTTEELAAFSKAQGEFLKKDEATGAILWFSPRYYGKTVKLGISQKSGKVFADTSNIQAANSLINQLGNGPLANAVAGKLADKILADAGMGGAPATPVAQEANSAGIENM